MRKERQLNLKIEIETIKMLKEKAYQKDISIAAIVREAIKRYFDAEEKEKKE